MVIFLDKQRPPKKRMGRMQRKGSKSNPATGVQWANWLDLPGTGGSIPPPVIPATGATAGIPGTFTPAGCTPPYDNAALQTVVASPATAWTADQHVWAGNGTSWHWNGTAWASGGAPAEEDAGTQGTPTSSWVKADIIAWIEANIETEGDLEACTKAELLELIEG